MNYQDADLVAQQILRKKGVTRNEKLQELCDYMEEEFLLYDWVGFYFAAESDTVLYLGPFAGEPTDHTVIPFGKGICGQVAVSGKTFVVDDVNAQDNYIACSIDVRSEIVVPIFVKGKNIGQIDIDSHTAEAFGDEDIEFLEKIAEEVALLFL